VLALRVLRLLRGVVLLARGEEADAGEDASRRQGLHRFGSPTLAARWVGAPALTRDETAPDGLLHARGEIFGGATGRTGVREAPREGVKPRRIDRSPLHWGTLLIERRAPTADHWTMADRRFGVQRSMRLGLILAGALLFSGASSA